MARLTTTVLAALVLPPIAARADDWPSPGLNSAHTRRSAESSGAVFADGRWSFAPAGRPRAVASPVVADGVVVVAYLDGTVVGMRADTGSPVWQRSAGAAVQGSPAIATGRVFVPTTGNKVVALAVANGAPLWATDVGGMALSSPAIVGRDIILAAGYPQRHVVRLDGATGAIVWQSPPVLEQFSNTAPAVAKGLVIVGSNGGAYHAFDLATGAPRWTYHADGIVHLAAPLVVGGRVYMAGGDTSDRVHAVDLVTGAPEPGWPVVLPSPDPDAPGALVDRHRAVSSLAASGGVILLQTRLDDALDTDGDGSPDHRLSRETVLAIDPATGALAWQHPLGRAVFTDPNDVPKMFLCPTTAGFGSRHRPLLAVASSLSGAVTILDVLSGATAGAVSVNGRALASPVVANGRIVTVSESGLVEAQLSSVNRPPSAPLLAATPHPLDAADVKLRWMAAMDPDGDLPAYELRLDSDGEVLQSWTQDVELDHGVTSVAITARLSAGVTYTWAVRARDSAGARSPWSAPETFVVRSSGAVSVDGIPAASLSAALTAARAGSVVSLGPGTYSLASTLHVASGVFLSGAGASRTVFDAAGLGVGISFDSGDGAHRTGLEGATVTGAVTCVSVGATAEAVSLTHLVAHGCTSAAVMVEAGGGAAIVNATLADSGAGVRASGSATIKNSLVTGNDIGLVALAGGSLISTYDDLFANQVAYQRLAAGPGDIATPIMFADRARDDYRLTSTQGCTDRGDPADGAAAEPGPNGGRINLGAFGGTAEAEPSAPAPALSASRAIAPPTPIVTPPATPAGTNAELDGGGCSLAGNPSRPHMAWVLTALVLCAACVRRRRRTVLAEAVCVARNLGLVAQCDHNAGGKTRNDRAPTPRLERQ